MDGVQMELGREQTSTNQRMIDLNISWGEKSCKISGSEEVFNLLFTLPPWKLPRIDASIKPSVLGCLVEIYEKANRELIPVLHSEFKNAKEDFDKKLSETGHVENKLTQDILIPGHFKIVRSVRVHGWKFDVQVGMKENSDEFLFTLISAEFKPKNNRNFAAPQVTKRSLERDLNKNRATAGNKKLELLVRKFQGNNAKLA